MDKIKNKDIKKMLFSRNLSDEELTDILIRTIEDRNSRENMTEIKLMYYNILISIILSSYRDQKKSLKGISDLMICLKGHANFFLLEDLLLVVDYFYTIHSNNQVVKKELDLLWKYLCENIDKTNENSTYYLINNEKTYY